MRRRSLESFRAAAQELRTSCTRPGGAGYAGALVWSVLAEDDQSGYTPEIAAWARTRSGGPGDVG